MKENSQSLWNGISDKLGTVWGGIKDVARDKFNEIAGKIKSTWTSSQQETDKVMPAISKTVTEKAAAALKGISDNFGKAESTIKTQLGNSMTAANKLDWSGVGNNIVDGISAGVRARAAALANSVANAASNALQAAKNVLQIHSPSRLFENEVGVNIGEGMALGVDESQRSVLASIHEMTRAATNSFVHSLSMGDIWENLRISTAKTWKTIEVDLANTWKRISQAASTSFANMNQLVSHAFSSMKANISVTVNGIINSIQRMSEGVAAGVNRAINAIRNLRVASADAVSLMSRAVSSVPIPRLASGAVIPPNREFLAVLGDQKSGTNVEAPLSTIKQALAEVLGETSYQRGGGEQTVILQVDRQVLGQVVYRLNGEQSRRIGVSLQGV